MTMKQPFITVTITVTLKIPLPPMPPDSAGAKKPEPFSMEGQRPVCRCRVRYGKKAA